MCRALLCLFASALLAWPSESYADPSKPIRDAMNHPASAFDLYMHMLNLELEQAFRPTASSEVAQVIAAIIERADLVDPKAEEGELFSAEWVDRISASPELRFGSFSYDFQANVFTLRLDLSTPDTSPLLQSDLSFEGETYRKKVLEDYVRQSWERSKWQIELTRIQNGYSSKAFEETAFKEEVGANTEVRLKWFIWAGGEPCGDFGKLLREKGVRARTYTAIRSKRGGISVTYRDQLEEEDGR